MRKLALAAAVVLLASVAHADSGDSTSYVYTGNQLSNSGNPNTLLRQAGSTFRACLHAHAASRER